MKRDRVRLREVGEQLHATAGEERLEQLAREVLGGLAHGLHAPRRERGGDQLADARVVGRLEPEQAPALDVPERLPARVRALGPELLVRAGLREVAAEPTVAQARTDVLVPGHEPAAEALVVKDGRRRAEGVQLRIRVGEEAGIGRIEHDTILLLVRAHSSP